MNYYGRRRYYVRYPRRTYRRTWASTSRSKRRAIGNYRAAIKQQDKTDVNLNITTKFKTFQGTTLTFQNGVYALNIWDLLRKSDFYQSYANMYDQIKINSIRIKLTPIMFHTHQTTNVTGSTFYSSYTVVTAWDRTGLSENQLELNIDGNSKNSGKIGAAVTEAGLYIKMKGEDVATYSSAITKSMSPNSNTAIIRTLYPSTIAEKGLYINTADLEAWYEGYDAEHVRYYGILNPEFVDGLASVTVPTVTQGQTVALKTPPYYLQTSQFYNKNPSTLHECPQFPFKPTLLVGLLNEAYTVDNGNGQNIRIEPLAEFNLEADIGVTFRGLRKAPIVASPEIVNKIILEQLHYSVRLSDSKYVDETVPLHTIPYVADTQQHNYDVYSHEIVLVLKYASNNDVVVHVFCNNSQVARNIKFDGPFWIKTINARDSLLDGTLALLAFEFTPYEDNNVFTFPWFKELQRNEFSYDTYIIKHNLYIMNFSTADIPDEPIQPESINLEEKQVTVTENGVTIVTPDLIEGYDALSSVEITTDVPSDVNNANVNTNSIITTNGTFSIPSGYTGFNNFEVAIPIANNRSVNYEISDQYFPNTNTVFNSYATFPVPQGYEGQKQLEIPLSLLYKSITANGSYSILNDRSFNSEIGYWKVDVNVPQGEMIMNALPGNNGVVTTNGQYNIPSGSTGFDSFTVNVPQTAVNNANVNANSIITTNGTFSIPSGYTGFNNFEVAIPISNERIINYTIDDQNYPNTNTTSTVNTTYPVPSGYQGQGNLTVPVKLLYKSITSNGSYSIVNNRSTNNELGYWKVDVNVPTTLVDNANVNANNNIISNGTYTVPSNKTGFNSFAVNVPQTQSALSIYSWATSVAFGIYLEHSYTKNSSGNYVYLSPGELIQFIFIKSNNDVEFKFYYYYNSTGSQYPIQYSNTTSCWYSKLTPQSKVNVSDVIYIQDYIGNNQFIINWYETYFSNNNPGLLSASITLPGGLISSNKIEIPLWITN